MDVPPPAGGAATAAAAVPMTSNAFQKCRFMWISSAIWFGPKDVRGGPDSTFEAPLLPALARWMHRRTLRWGVVPGERLLPPGRRESRGLHPPHLGRAAGDLS